MLIATPLIGFASGGALQPSLVSSSVNASDLATFTSAHTLGLGATLMLCAFAINQSKVGNSVTWDPDGVNQALTFKGKSTNSGMGAIELWSLVNPLPATGSSLVEFVASGTSDAIGYVTAWANAADILNQVGDNGDAQTSASATVTNVVGSDIVFSSLYRTGTQAFTIGADQTQIEITRDNTPNSSATSYQDGKDGGIMSYSWTGAEDYTHRGCRIPLL